MREDLVRGGGQHELVNVEELRPYGAVGKYGLLLPLGVAINL